MMFDLAFIWAAIIAFAVLAYVILDGFDLGIGILFPFFPKRHDRDVMTNSIAPVWDGNETWLVLGGGGLMAVFPVAYATVLPAPYMLIILMLFGLIFRGVAFEFRWRTTRGSIWWDWRFCIGSTIAAMMQGIALGALVQGIRISNRAYAGGWWDWLTPFSITTGLAVVVGYVLLCATWLNLKTTGPLQAHARKIATVRCGNAGPYRCCQPMDTLYQPGLFRALVRLANSLFLCLCAVAAGSLRGSSLAGIDARQASSAISGGAWHFRDLLCWSRCQLLSLHRAWSIDDMGGRCTG